MPNMILLIFLVKGLENMLNKRSTIAIKRMGEIDRSPFQTVCKERYSAEDWEEQCAKLCTFWQDSLMDPHWHPFKTAIINGTKQVSIST